MVVFGSKIKAPQASAEGEAVVLGGSGTIPQDLLPETSGGGQMRTFEGDDGFVQLFTSLTDYVNIGDEVLCNEFESTNAGVTVKGLCMTCVDADKESRIANFVASGYVEKAGQGSTIHSARWMVSMTMPGLYILRHSDAVEEAVMIQVNMHPTNTPTFIVVNRSLSGGGSTSSGGGWQTGTGSSGS